MRNKRIIILGGGITGLLTGYSLAKFGISITIIEKKNFISMQDGRSFAISASSKEILEEYGLWDSIASKAGNIDEIRITNNNSSLFLHFDAEAANNQPMGYMVPAKLLLEVLCQKLSSMQNVSLLLNTNYQNVSFTPETATVHLENKEEYKAELLIIAEGKNSTLRSSLNIRTTTIPYNQVALVFNISHQYHHNFVALENFYSHGPFASLPLYGGFQSAIVWTEKINLKEYLLQMDQKEFIELFQQKFGDHLGEISLTTPIQAFELSATFAEYYYFKRAALIGDAAHAIHPIAGQGLNLSIRDIHFLTILIKTQFSLGLDIGSTLMLSKYDKYRQKDNNAMIAVTDICNRLFSHNFKTLKYATNIGLAAINNLPHLKKTLVNYAMGFRKSI
jgi:2-octaprenyl-6-methoxyphenol hydroxylase